MLGSCRIQVICNWSNNLGFVSCLKTSRKCGKITVMHDCEWLFFIKHEVTVMYDDIIVQLSGWTAGVLASFVLLVSRSDCCSSWLWWCHLTTVEYQTKWPHEILEYYCMLECRREVQLTSACYRCHTTLIFTPTSCLKAPRFLPWNILSLSLWCLTNRGRHTQYDHFIWWFVRLILKGSLIMIWLF